MEEENIHEVLQLDDHCIATAIKRRLEEIGNCLISPSGKQSGKEQARLQAAYRLLERFAREHDLLALRRNNPSLDSGSDSCVSIGWSEDGKTRWKLIQ